MFFSRILKSAPAVFAGLFVGLTTCLLFKMESELAQRQATLRGELSMIVFLDRSLSEEETKTFAERLGQELPGIEESRLVSREEALQQAQQDPSLSQALIILKDNPLPASIHLRFNDAVWGSGSPAAGLQERPEVSEVRWDARLQTDFQTILRWRKQARGFAAALVVLFLGAAFPYIIRKPFLH